jgi:hypothetical protein
MRPVMEATRGRAAAAADGIAATLRERRAMVVQARLGAARVGSVHGASAFCREPATCVSSARRTTITAAAAAAVAVLAAATAGAALTGVARTVGVVAAAEAAAAAVMTVEAVTMAIRAPGVRIAVGTALLRRHQRSRSY